MKNNFEKEMPIVYRFGEAHCPNCGLELYYKWEYEIEVEKKKLTCQCGITLIPNQLVEEKENPNE